MKQKSFILLEDWDTWVRESEENIATSSVSLHSHTIKRVYFSATKTGNTTISFANIQAPHKKIVCLPVKRFVS